MPARDDAADSDRQRTAAPARACGQAARHRPGAVAFPHTRDVFYPGIVTAPPPQRARAARP
jgi:hypothetical protein